VIRSGDWQSSHWAVLRWSLNWNGFYLQSMAANIDSSHHPAGRLRPTWAGGHVRHDRRIFPRCRDRVFSTVAKSRSHDWRVLAFGACRFGLG
jgi:hypothetical protein